MIYTSKNLLKCFEEERKENESRTINSIEVLGRYIRITFDDYDKMPKNKEEIDILKLQLEVKIADGEITFDEDGAVATIRHFPEGYTVGPILYARYKRQFLSEKKNISIDRQTTGEEAREQDCRLFRVLKANAVARSASWNNARNSNVL